MNGGETETLRIEERGSSWLHRRRIMTEEKRKVIAAVWVKKLIQFLAALASFHQDDLKKRIN